MITSRPHLRRARLASVIVGAALGAAALGVVTGTSGIAYADATATKVADAQSNFMGSATSETNGNTFFGGNRGDGVIDGLWVVTPGNVATRIVSAAVAADMCVKPAVNNNYNGLVVLTWHDDKVYVGCSGLGRVWSLPDTTTTPIGSVAAATLEFQVDPAKCANATAGGSYNPEGSFYGGAFDADGAFWFSDNFNSSSLYVHAVGSDPGSCTTVTTNPWRGVNDMEFGEDGKLYYSYDWGSSIYRIDPANSNAYEVYSATDPTDCSNGYEGFAMPRGLDGTILASCTNTSGGVTVIPQNPDGSAGTPEVVFDWSTGGQYGMYAFAGICDGRYLMANYGITGTAVPGQIWVIEPIVEGMCVPQHPTAVAGGGSATVSWDAVPPYSVESYTVTASSGQTCTIDAPATSCVVTGLTVGAEVTFTVVANYPAGTSNESVDTAAVIPTVPALPPTGSSTSTNAAIALSFLFAGTALLTLAGRRRRAAC